MSAPSNLAPLASGDRPWDETGEPVRIGVLALLAPRPRALWHVRGLLYQFVLRDVRVRYRQAVLGLLWALLIPTLTVLAGTLIRFVALRTGVGHTAIDDRSAIAGVAVKAVAWSFFASSLSAATTSLSTNAGLVARVYFPREILPLAAVLAQGVDLFTASVSVTILLVVLGVGVSPTLLWVPVLLVMLVALTASLAAVFACANLFFRDVRYLVQVLTTFGLFFTPVFLDVAQLGRRVAGVAMLNPVAPLLEGLRLSVIDRHNLLRPLALPDGMIVWHPWYLAYSATWAIVAVIAGALLYARLEFSFAEYV